mmetsp:Transcript_7907/g.10329  ORF Transcript_7907/g.10329 Transcript_7907/m.10329 type:complete len:287 (-) Transcript_7907:2057-2917(-)
MSRLRQVAIAVKDYEKCEQELTKVLSSFVTFNDPDIEYFGLRNGLIPIGNTFLEIVSPLEQGEKLSSSAAGRFLQRFGDGGYMILVQVANGESMFRAYESAKKQNFQIIHKGGKNSDLDSVDFPNLEQGDTSGPGFEEDGIMGFHLHPKNVGCIAEITVQKPRNKWLWAGNQWCRSDERTRIAHSPSIGIVAVDIASNEPELTAMSWIRLLNLDLEDCLSVSNEGTVFSVTLDDESVLSFRKATSPLDIGLQRIYVETHSTKLKKNEIRVIGGVEFCFVKHLEAKL